MYSLLHRLLNLFSMQVSLNYLPVRSEKNNQRDAVDIKLPVRHCILHKHKGREGNPPLRNGVHGVLDFVAVGDSKDFYFASELLLRTYNKYSMKTKITDIIWEKSE